MRRKLPAVCLVALVVVLGGCSGTTLPEPRLPDDDEEQAVENSNPADSPAATPTPSSTPVPEPEPVPLAAKTANAAPPATSALGSPPPASAGRSVEAIRPGNALTMTERRGHSIACLEAIAGGLKRYWEKQKRYPDCYYHLDDQPYLSWRVELLPYLGYEKLYRRFDYREPWDGPNNRRLLAEIPPIYQSPERGDERTNFLLAVGQYTAYVASGGPRVEGFPDGMDNTILLVEVDEAHAVPWTRPDDLIIDADGPSKGVFSLREDGFFAVMANLVVRQIPSSIDESKLAALWTARGKETANILEWTSVPVETVDEKLAAAFRATQKSADVLLSSGSLGGVDGPATASAVKGGRSPIGSPALTTGDELLPASSLPSVPSPSEIKKAEELIKQVYGGRYEKAKTETERREIAATMLGEAESVRHELAAYYTQLRIARDIATDNGDLPGAQQAVERLESTFELDIVAERLPWIEAANKHVKSTSDASLLADQAKSLFEIALEQDAFDECRKTHTIFLSLARRANDGDRIVEASRLRERLDLARKEHAKIAEHLHVLLRSPRDPQANFEVGKYLWLVKQSWVRGAEHLARGPDSSLRKPALLELKRPSIPEYQAELGDLYWSLSESSEYTKHSTTLRNRAVDWYRLALPQHADGLRKALIQERIRVAEESNENELRKQT